MPNYAKLGYSETLDVMKEHGKLLAEFNQGRFRTDFAKSGSAIHTEAEGKGMGGGYCAGVAHDWIRRVLLGRPGRDLDIGYISFYYQALKAGSGHEGRSVAELQQLAYEAVGRMGKAWRQVNGVWWTQTKDKSKEVVMSGGMKNAFETIDSAHKRKRPFSDLLILRSGKYSGLKFDKEWINIIAGALPAGYATKLGFDKKGGGGHAVAAWRRKESWKDKDGIFFFDPNFGVFETSINGLSYMLEVLFRTDAENTAFYDGCSERDNQSMNFISYGPPRLVDGSSLPTASGVKALNVVPPTNHSANSIDTTTLKTLAYSSPKQQVPAQPSGILQSAAEQLERLKKNRGMLNQRAEELKKKSEERKLQRQNK